jgi:hypothetical protein
MNRKSILKATHPGPLPVLVKEDETAVTVRGYYGEPSKQF